MSRVLIKPFPSAMVILPRMTRRSTMSSNLFSTNPHQIMLDTKDTNRISGNNTSLLHKKASIRRTFESSANAQAMLICGGPQLASNASFDPMYSRAKHYIRNHAVGQAVLSPILINGLIGALVESEFPSGFMEKCNLVQRLPLIVGCEVEAYLEVTGVNQMSRSGSNTNHNNNNRNDNIERLIHMEGIEVDLITKLTRVSDGKEIAVGTQTIWLPEDLQCE